MMGIDRGFIYLMKNKAMPNVYKIGLTRRNNVQIRVKELSSTSVPFDFEVLSHEGSMYCGQLEEYLHDEFKSHRLNKGKEFFEFSCDHDAIASLSKAVSEFIPDTSIKVDVKPREKNTTSQQAKQLGCKSLAQLAEFYECTTQHLRNIHKRNNKAFKAMCLGYLEVTRSTIDR